MKPATSDQRPATSDQRPATSDQRPATSDQRPATSDQRPATGNRLLIAVNIFLILLLAAIAAKEGYWQKVTRSITGEITPASATPHYRSMAGIHRRQIAQALASSDVRIAFIGDSIVEGWLTSAVVARSINLGIGRDTIPGMMARTDPQLIQHVPTWYIGIGINDAIRDRDPALIPELVEQISSAYGAADSLIWRAALPVAGDGWDADREAFRRQLNTQSQAACDQLPNCTFLETPEGYVENVAAWTSDGLHPNAEGYRALTDQLCQVITCLTDGP